MAGTRSERTSLRRCGRLGLGSGAMGIRKDSSSAATGGKAGTHKVCCWGENPSELASVTQERLQLLREGSEVEKPAGSACRSCWGRDRAGTAGSKSHPAECELRRATGKDSVHLWPFPNTENVNKNSLSRPHEKSHLQYRKIR